MFSIFKTKVVDRAEKYRKVKYDLHGKKYNLLDEVSVTYKYYADVNTVVGLFVGTKWYSQGSRYVIVLDETGETHSIGYQYIKEMKKKYSVLPEVFEHIDEVNETDERLKKKEEVLKKAMLEYEASRKRMEALAKKSESFVKEGIIEAHSLIAKSHDS